MMRVKEGEEVVKKTLTVGLTNKKKYITMMGVKDGGS